MGIKSWQTILTYVPTFVQVRLHAACHELSGHEVGSPSDAFCLFQLTWSGELDLTGLTVLLCAVRQLRHPSTADRNLASARTRRRAA